MLQYNQSLSVNHNQYNFFKRQFKGLIAYRTDGEGNFYIKPLSFAGLKSLMEECLIKLS